MRTTKAHRWTADEIRAQMLRSALHLVRANGLTIGFEQIQMDEIIRASGVPRSSAFRLWESRGAFIDELLVEVAETSSHRLIDHSDLANTVLLINQNQHLLDTPSGRRALMLEVIRLSLEDRYFAVIDSTEWQAVLSLSTSLLGGMPSVLRDRLTVALSTGTSGFIDHMSESYRSVMDIIGFRMKVEACGDYRLFAVLCSALVEGLVILHATSPQLTDNFFPGPSTLSAPTDWSPISLGVLALFDRFMEPNEKYDYTSALKRLDAIDPETASPRPGHGLFTARPYCSRCNGEVPSANIADRETTHCRQDVRDYESQTF